MEISKTGGRAREGELERKGKKMERGRKIFIIALSKLSLDDSMWHVLLLLHDYVWYCLLRLDVSVLAPYSIFISISIDKKKQRSLYFYL